MIEFQSIGDTHYTILRDKLYSWATSTQKIACCRPRFQEVSFELYFKPEIGEYLLVFWTITPQLAPTYLRQGPQINLQSSLGQTRRDLPNISKFLGKHPDAFEKNGYYWVPQAREFTDFTDFLSSQLDKRMIADSLQVINLPNLVPTTVTGRQAIYVLREMVLPFEPPT